MQHVCAAWAALGGVIYDAGYAITLARMVMAYRKGDCMPFDFGAYGLFAFASLGYLGYFVEVDKNPVMAGIAAAGLLLLVAIIGLGILMRLSCQRQGS